MPQRDDPDDTGDLYQRPLGELLKQLSEETTRLVRQEIELAKAEVTARAREAVGSKIDGAREKVRSAASRVGGQDLTRQDPPRSS